MSYPKYEVWGGFIDDFDEPSHLEDCFTLQEAEQACKDYSSNRNYYAFIREKND